jgi:hypothetical protein
MAYIGNTAENQAFTPRVDYFSGNASATAFTLSFPVASVAQVQAVIENVPQAPGDAYTVSGNTITFTSAPPSGTNNIYVYYTSPITQVIQPGQGTVGTAQLQSGVLTPTAVSDQLNSSTGYFDLPAGTTAQRPASPVFGMIRANTTTGFPEWYSATAALWINFADGLPYEIEHLVIAGGGGGGGRFYGGGGGAGGYRSSVTGQSSGGGASAEAKISLIPNTNYIVTVGAGGAGGAAGNSGVQGSDSVFSSITSLGGGFGGQGVAGANGGSGGGSGLGYDGGLGTTGQGYRGGVYTGGAGTGGGGAGQAGMQGTSGSTQSGGNGVSSNITGSAVTRAGGGGGAMDANVAYFIALGGSGGGGNAAADYLGSAVQAVAGTTNTGSGGGGGCWNNTTSGAAGGSGIVIIRYLGSQRGTGGTVTSSGGYTIHSFTSSGTYTA